MEIDRKINGLREATPGCQRLVHFNNAGCSLMPTPVLDSLINHLRLEQLVGGYEAADQATDRIENFYRAFARLLNCAPEEIAYVENATRAWDMAFYAIPFQPGDQVITGQAEYASNFLAMLQLKQRKGIDLIVIPNDGTGSVCLESLCRAITGQTRLIALTHIPSQVGTPQPATEVGAIARDHGILYLLDACQSAGQVPLDTQKLQCDMLTGTGRKYLRGPRGTGFLYVSKRILQQLEPPFIDLHAARWLDEQHYAFRPDARRFENWECYVAGKLALGAAADYACNLGLEWVQARIEKLAGLLVDRLTELLGVKVHEQRSNLSGIVTFNRNNESPADLQMRLRAAGINTGVSKRSNAVLDFGRRALGDVNRASLHYYNTEEEIDRFIEVLVGEMT